MSTNGNILFTKDVMAELRYGAMSAFYAFMNDEKNKFPRPFKIGRRNAWHRDDVASWLERQRKQANEYRQ
ncbi:AlpA family phage regulatory protein [Escherichia coli]|nr:MULTISPECIES: AlpA family phage regulatory protein [Escherichia]EKH5997990.1 AlpA family phage regulatory protein [Escherichia coli O8]EEQ1700042.1 AlpA family phage regulatory protein [Escherichia coli]EEQ3958741.1 AlpA family phage regulatory protein [Escherichia coli]EEQ4525423.1 AlpA family phage regulatory protein [Escherichia coli]EEQ7705943.1 AlpA family phage regulatory protein [Escherichia coli]